MIQLTPLDKTVAGQELMQIAREESEKETRKETARNVLSMGLLTPVQISQATGLSIENIHKFLHGYLTPCL